MAPSRPFLGFHRLVRRIQLLHGGLKKGSHTIFKSLYAKSCQRRRFAMDKVLGRYNERLYINYFLSGKEEQRTFKNQCEVYAISNGNSMMDRLAVKAILVDLDSFLPLLSSQRETAVLIASQTSIFHRHILKVGQECFRALHRFLYEHFAFMQRCLNGMTHEVVFSSFSIKPNYN